MQNAHRWRRRHHLFAASLALAALVVAAAAMSAAAQPKSSVPTVYFASLSGPGESPPNTSPATGQARVDLDLTAHTMRVRVTFSGLQGTATASHIHACTAAPGTGTAGVATQVPTFGGFPLGVTSGTYDRTFDTLDAATYNPAFVSAHGATAAGAEAALADCIAAGRAYLNVHSSAFGGGEIRGFLTPAPQPTDKDQCKGGGYQGFIDPGTGDFFTNQGQCVSFVAAGGKH
jgi:uncharacterized protein YraI